MHLVSSNPKIYTYLKFHAHAFEQTALLRLDQTVVADAPGSALFLKLSQVAPAFCGVHAAQQLLSGVVQAVRPWGHEPTHSQPGCLATRGGQIERKKTYTLAHTLRLGEGRGEGSVSIRTKHSILFFSVFFRCIHTSAQIGTKYIL